MRCKSYSILVQSDSWSVSVFNDNFWSWVQVVVNVMTQQSVVIVGWDVECVGHSWILIKSEIQFVCVPNHSWFWTCYFLNTVVLSLGDSSIWSNVCLSDWNKSFGDNCLLDSIIGSVDLGSSNLIVLPVVLLDSANISVFIDVFLISTAAHSYLFMLN